MTQRQGATVKELRAAIGITRERLEAAYDYLVEKNPVLGLAVQRHGDELRLVSDGQVAVSVERHLSAPRPVALSGRHSRCWPSLPTASRFVTTPAFLEYLGLRDLADLPPLASVLNEGTADHAFLVLGWTP